MRTPFSWIPSEARIPILRRIFPLFTIVGIFMAALDSQLKSPISPFGIIDLQLTGSLDRVLELFGQWQGATRDILIFSLGADFTYAICYGLTFGIGCLIAADKFPKKKTFFELGSWAVAIAASLDWFENAACVQAVLHGPTLVTTRITFIIASIKYILVLPAIIAAIGAYLIPKPKA